MPPPFVKTIREELLYEYAKLISRSAYGTLARGFITDRFQKLRAGDITISGTIREWEQEQQLPHTCVYCGAADELTTDHLIARRKGGDDIADNVVLACKSCNASKGDKGIFEWLGLKKKDELHRLVAGKYLKQLFEIHAERGTLDVDRNNIHYLCRHCGIHHACVQWESVGELTCFCLESVLPA